MGELSPERVDEIVDSINQQRDGGISLVELLSLTKIMVESLQSIVDDLDDDLGSDVQAIARHIERTQLELGEIPADSMAELAMPDVDMDLKEVVQSTEAATNTILQSAEQIMSASDEDMDTYRQTVDDAVMAIFEACCFQDLTGQRISRVSDTLSQISQHLKYVTDVINGCRATRPFNTITHAGSGPAMHGPQSGDDAVSQDLADSLFEDFDMPDNVIPIKN